MSRFRRRSRISSLPRSPVPSMATVGSEVSVATEILNQGSLAAGPFQLGFYLLTLDLANIFPLAGCEYDLGLEVGGSSRCSGSVPLPGSISPGTYLLASFVDVTDQVTESDEDNNARLADSGLLTVLVPTTTSRIFVPVVLSAAGRNDSFFTSEVTLTNRGNRIGHPPLHLHGPYGRRQRNGHRQAWPRGSSVSNPTPSTTSQASASPFPAPETASEPCGWRSRVLPR